MNYLNYSKGGIIQGELYIKYSSPNCLLNRCYYNSFLDLGILDSSNNYYFRLSI